MHVAVEHSSVHGGYDLGGVLAYGSDYFGGVLGFVNQIARINALDPDILLVAMGVPIQEKWIARHRGELVCGAALAVVRSIMI